MQEFYSQEYMFFYAKGRILLDLRARAPVSKVYPKNEIV